MKYLVLLKKHYEKILLGAVLLGLVLAVFLLMFQIDSERTAMEEKRNQIINQTIPPLPDLNLSEFDVALKRASDPVQFKYSAPPHNLINPVQWQKGADGSLIKVATGTEIGPSRVEVTNISPLYLTISLDSVGATGSNYMIKVERQAAVRSSDRTRTRSVSIGQKTEVFTLRDVKGPLDNPTELIIELNESGEVGTLAPGRPFRKVDGYTVGLKYDPEKTGWKDKKVGSSIRVAGEEDVISSIILVASNQYEVVLSAKLTDKKTTISYKAVP